VLVFPRLIPLTSLPRVFALQSFYQWYIDCGSFMCVMNVDERGITAKDRKRDLDNSSCLKPSSEDTEVRILKKMMEGGLRWLLDCLRPERVYCFCRDVRAAELVAPSRPLLMVDSPMVRSSHSFLAFSAPPEA
jgi:hypothetical protein